MINKTNITAITTIMAITILLTTTTIDNAEAYTVDPALIQKVQNYAVETHHGTDHVERWNRVLHAFGVIQHTSTMTAQEAQTYVDKGWNRWIPVVEALKELEKAATIQQQDTTAPVITLQGPASVTLTVGDIYTDAGATCTDDTDGAISVSDDSANVDTQTPNSYTITYSCTDTSGNIATPVYRTVTVEEPPTQTNLVEVDQTVIDAVTNWRNEQAVGTPHYERWDRVLAAFGTVDRTDVMTAQEAQTYVDKGWQRWVAITDILRDIESAAQQQSQQQGALENPQYTQQQDQLPSTQQDQQLTPIPQEYKRVKAQGLAIHRAIADLWRDTFDEWFANQAKYDQLKYAELRAVYNSYSFDGNNPSFLITRAESNNQHADYVERIREAIPRAEEVYAQMRILQGELYYGTILDLCPQINPTSNRALVNYIKAEVVYKSVIGINDTTPYIGNIVSSTSNSTHKTYTYTDGTLAHDLTERICAYHDLDYGETHKKLVAEAMLALGIHPETFDITPMSAEKAFEMEKIHTDYYASQHAGYDKNNPMHPKWEGLIWKETATKIQQLESDNYYEENKDRIESHHTNICDLDYITCNPSNTIQYTDSSKSVKRVVHEYYDSGYLKKIIYYNEDGTEQIENSYVNPVHYNGTLSVYIPELAGLLLEEGTHSQYIDGKLVSSYNYDSDANALNMDIYYSNGKTKTSFIDNANPTCYSPTDTTSRVVCTLDHFTIGDAPYTLP